MAVTRFWLGTHQPHWLARTCVPLFISARRLRSRKTLPRALGEWALDSGGFSELSLYGNWSIDANQYAGEVRRYSQEIGNLAWAACQDWMCEPVIREKTGLSIREHQERTVQSYLDLLSLAPEVSWMPVLQGWDRGDYLRHREQYACAGINLSSLPLVGLGSVCRRQDSGMVEDLIRVLAGEHGIRLHLFGFKLKGLARVNGVAASSDSMAWSFAARRESPLPGHESRHKNCANCLDYALLWHKRILDVLARPQQKLLF